MNPPLVVVGYRDEDGTERRVAGYLEKTHLGVLINFVWPQSKRCANHLPINSGSILYILEPASLQQWHDPDLDAKQGS